METVYDLKKRLAVLMVIALALVFIIIFIINTNEFNCDTVSPDGDSYISIAKFFKGEIDDYNKFRISRPIIPILTIPLSFITSYKNSFIFLNAFFFIILVFVFYKLTSFFFENNKYAFYSTLLLVFAFPVYYRGINVSVDLAWWLICTAIFLAVVYLSQNNKFNLRYLIY